MEKVMTSASTKPAVKVLLSQIALIVVAVNDCMCLGATAPITKAVPSPSPGVEDTYVEAPTIPRSHPMKSVAMVWMMCAINVWSVNKRPIREGGTFINIWYLRDYDRPLALKSKIHNIMA